MTFIVGFSNVCQGNPCFLWLVLLYGKVWVYLGWICWHMQSVLVTVDRHEWYAPPQLYKRDDTTGLWQTKFALPSPSQVGTVAAVHFEAKKPPSDSVGCVVGEGAMDGDSVIVSGGGERDSGITSNLYSAGDPAVSTTECIDNLERIECKRRRVQDQLAEDGIITSDCKVEQREVITTESLAIDHIEGVDNVAGVTRANASVAERMIEPALVMFEVKISTRLILMSYSLA